MTDRAVAEDEFFFGKPAQFFERDVRRLLEHGEGQDAMCLNPTQAPIAPQRLGLGIALFMFAIVSEHEP